MISMAHLWIPFVVLAASAQVARNAMQRNLTGPLGNLGATHIRFLFGFPFALVFLGLVFAVVGDKVPSPGPSFLPWLLLGTLTQIAATALMLSAMHIGSFVVTTAYTKTEPIQAALFGFVFLSDILTVWKVVAIVIATTGVIVTALRPGAARGFGNWRPTVLGLAAAAIFALSSVGYRGAILAVPDVSFVTAATFTLAMGLFIQTVLLTGYLLVFDRGVLREIFRLWKPSMLAGFMGAFASQFWFLAFAITAVANVRTLALIEVLIAQGVSYYKFKQPVSTRELVGIGLIIVGVGLLVVA